MKRFKVKLLSFILFSVLVSELVRAQISRPLSEPLPDDNFEVLLARLTTVRNIFELSLRGLSNGQSSYNPWSSSYWPIHRGVLANRYADPSFPHSRYFQDNYSNFQSRPAENLVRQGEIDRLSPAEKYDLLVGDSTWGLTRAMWEKGLNDLRENGVVAGWTGICHGWAAVTHMGTEVPKHSVTVRDVTNTYDIKFLSDDIRGLLSYLWAESPPETLKAGNRCRQSPIEIDPHLRPTDPSCLDTNPMSWHLTLTNRVGIYQKSYVMDASSGAEVWNYPIKAYDYSYFNPRTFESSHSLSFAIEPIQNLTADRFASFRSQNAKYVVGIAMDVFHPALVEPKTGDSTEITYQTHSFIYDLELDENFNVIGGEWYSHERPDFLWTFADDSRATTREDLNFQEIWDAGNPLPKIVAENAIVAARRSKILAKIVDVLHQQSLK